MTTTPGPIALGVEGGRGGAWLGAVLTAALLIGIVAPRTFTFVLPAMVCLTLVVGTARGVSFRPSEAMKVAMSAVGGFYGLALVSALWSVAPGESAVKSVTVGAAALATMGCMVLVMGDSGEQRRRLGVGVLIAVLAGATFLAFEAVTGGAIQIALFNAIGVSQRLLKEHYIFQNGRLAAIDNVWINRSLIAAILLMFPAMLAARRVLTGWARLVVPVALVVLVSVATFFSGSETAKLALLASLLVLAAGALTPVWTTRALMLGWALACIAVVPLMLAAPRFVGDLEKLSALKGASPAARIRIASDFAKLVVAAPILGHGANSAYALGSTATPSDKGTPLAQHPHNAYLQVWFELGAVGAGFFLAVGIVILRGLGRLDRGVVAYALGQFAAVACVLAPAYGFWQYWQAGLIAASVLAMGVALAAAREPVGVDDASVA